MDSRALCRGVCGGLEDDPKACVLKVEESILENSRWSARKTRRDKKRIGCIEGNSKKAMSRAVDD